ncbi:MAG: ferritin-like domain-containing protein [Deltaproteobacteria bacterium]|nr:ferritin-like domain-containing protein [Deltaproteobacteria bacterium]
MGQSYILANFDLVEGEETRLYEMAKSEQWNASTDIDWSKPVGWSKKLTKETALAYRADVISQFWYGEQGALAVCAQLIPLVPDMSAKLYLSSQVIDEARHTEVFGRYLNLIGGPTQLNPHLERLLLNLLEAPGVEEKLVGMQVLAEGLALDSFHSMMDTTSDALLRDILAKVSQDESRHLGFGVLYLKRRIAQTTPERRAEVEKALAGYAHLIAKSTGWRNPNLPPPPAHWQVESSGSSFAEYLLKNLRGRLSQIGLKLAA